MDPLSALKMVGLPDWEASWPMRPRTPAPPRKFPFRTCRNCRPAWTSPLPAPPRPSGSASFSNVLGGFVQEVSDKQAAASDAVTGLLSGKNVSLHQTMISMEEASVSFQLMVEVRNRLLDSYQELMRMQV